jgi:hypothetical protein
VLSSTRLVQHKQRGARLAAAGLAAIGLTTLAAAPAWGSGSARSGGPNAAKWCADVIRINTQSGLMKNKHYLPASQVTLAQYKRVIEAALAKRAQLLAETPTEIKTATSHELAYFARLKANNYAPTTTMTPYTAGDATKLINYQHAHCGITGP